MIRADMTIFPFGQVKQGLVKRLRWFVMLLPVLLLSWGQEALAIDIKRLESPGGLTVWLVEDHSNPVFSLSFAFQGGSGNDPAGQEGLANFLAGTMDEGAGPYDSESFRKQLNDQSISLSFSARRNFFHGKIKALTKYRDSAAELMRLALNEPRFDEDAVERIREQIILSVESNARQTDSVASSHLRQAFYGDHSFARESDGTVESIRSITVDDLRRFKDSLITKDKLTIGLVGDLSEAEALSLVDDIMGGLPSKPALALAPAVMVDTKAETQFVTKDVPQTTIVMGHRGLPRNDPDYFAAYLLNHIMGGSSFGSRLYNEVREKRGLTYGVYSYMNADLNYEIVVAQMSTANETVDQAIEILRQEWQKMAEHGPTEEELEKARRYVVGSYPLHYTTTSSIARLLVELQLYDLGYDYPERREDYFNAVTLEQAKRTAARFFQPEALHVVAVGGKRN